MTTTTTDGDDDEVDDDEDNGDDNDLMRLQNFDLNDADGFFRVRGAASAEDTQERGKTCEPWFSWGHVVRHLPFSDRPNRKKCMAPQDDVERRVQPKHNAKNTTSYRDLDNHVIYKRTRPINSSCTVLSVLAASDIVY